jgi:hypothetical protein
VNDRVIFLGAVASDMLPACYAAADIFVHPNRIEGGDFEGFGLVFLEAAAAGLPVIAGETGGAVARRRRSKPERQACWCPEPTSPNSCGRSDACWPILTAVERWARRAGTEW